MDISADDSPVWIGSSENTNLGELWVAVSARGLVAVDFPADHEAFVDYLHRRGFQTIVQDDQRVRSALTQIAEYVRGERREFDLAIDWSHMGSFQEQVLRFTFAIPYGQTFTYGEIARRLARPQAARAVGRAQATNPMPLVIPCHRVLGSDGKLHGYGAGKGLETKAWLLHMEADNLPE